MASDGLEAWELATTLTERELGPKPGWRNVVISLGAVPAVAILATRFVNADWNETRMAVAWTTLIVVGVVFLFELARRNHWSKVWERNLHIRAPELPEPDSTNPPSDVAPPPPPPKPTPVVTLSDRLSALDSHLAEARKRRP